MIFKPMSIMMIGFLLVVVLLLLLLFVVKAKLKCQ